VIASDLRTISVLNVLLKNADEPRIERLLNLLCEIKLRGDFCKLRRMQSRHYIKSMLGLHMRQFD